jgi:glycosyltransferase involved in cell wall biosynthesis
VLAMDNPWQNQPRQWLGVLFRKQLIRPFFDSALVPGTKQEKFAEKLGFNRNSIYRNLFSIDKNIFTNSKSINRQPSQSFLFVGRLIPDKGFDVLLNAYQKYASSVESPWDLKIVGTGPLKELCSNMQGVSYIGFLSHIDLIKLYQNSNCLLLPSRHEPWGIVLQEAASQGLPIIATANVGAVGDLLVDQFNGFVISKSSVKKIYNSLISMHNLSYEQHAKLSMGSFELSKNYEVCTFAERVEEIYKKNFTYSG